MPRVKRGRLFFWGFLTFACSIPLTASGYNHPEACLSLQKLISPDFRTGDNHMLCDAARIATRTIIPSSPFAAAWGATMCLVAFIGAAAVAGALGRAKSLSPRVRWFAAALGFGPVLFLLVLFGMKATSLSARQPPPPSPATAVRDFRLSDYDGDSDGSALLQALETVFGNHASRGFVDAVLSSQAAAAPPPSRDSVAYTYRPRSFLSCVLSATPMPSVWEITVTFSPSTGRSTGVIVRAVPG